MNLLCKAWVWAKECSCGSRGTKLSLARDSCWEHYWTDSAANTLIPSVETKRTKHDCGHVSPLGCGTWKPSLTTWMSGPKMFQAAFDTFFFNNLLQVQYHQRIREIFCALFMTVPWSYWIVLDLFQCQGSFFDLDSRGALRLRLPPCANAQDEQGFCPQLIRVNPTGSQGVWPKSL